MRPPGRLAGALAAACLLAAGCGSAAIAPQGNPDTRRGARSVDAYASIELLRALVVASSDAYYAGGAAEDAESELRRARAAYDGFAHHVRALDPALDREVVARFDLLARLLPQGVRPDHYRDLVDPLLGQLLEGVLQTLVPVTARNDAGVQAEALRRVSLRLSATYDAATAPDEQTSRLAFEESWGLWRRALALEGLVAAELGPQKDPVAGALNGLRGKAFPQGPLPTDQPDPLRVDRASLKVVQALEKRFALSA